MQFDWHKLLAQYLSPTVFPFSLGWYCGAGVIELIGCESLSPSPALQTSLNNKKNNLIVASPDEILMAS